MFSSIPYSNFGNTQGYNDDYDIICDAGASTSPDVVYSFTPDYDMVVDVVQPASIAGLDTPNRDGTILGPREPGFYEYYVKAQTGNGVSEPSNVASVEIQNNSPSEFFLIAPEDSSTPLQTISY